MAALTELAASLGSPGRPENGPENDLDDAFPGERELAKHELAEHEPHLPDAMAPAAEPEAFAFAWTVSAGASAVRRLTGAEPDRNHLVAKLREEDAPRASRLVGTEIRDADGAGPPFRVVAVARGIDGSGFGTADDVLVVGDPGEGIGALVRGEAEAEEAA
jgi:hypothetical protein